MVQKPERKEKLPRANGKTNIKKKALKICADTAGMPPVAEAGAVPESEPDGTFPNCEEHQTGPADVAPTRSSEPVPRREPKNLIGSYGRCGQKRPLCFRHENLRET